MAGLGADETTVLDEDDFRDVKKEVIDVAAKWQDLGSSLGIRMSDIENIRSAHASPTDRLSDMLILWLRQSYKVERHGKPTWRRLAEAVKDESGGKNTALAETIAANHPAKGAQLPPPPQPTPPVQPLPSNGSVAMAAPDRAQAKWFPEEDRQRVSVDGKNDKKITFERFEPLKRDKMKKPISLSFTNVSPKSSDKGSDKGRGFAFYEMGSFPHGIALIINNEEFSRQADREGTGIDEKNLIQTFRYLGYIVEVHRDRSGSQMKDIFDEVSARRDHSKYDSFICCILSHGKEGKIYGSDSDIVDIDDLVKKLNGERCKLLGSKPKMFFVQACRGKGRDTGTRVASDSEEPRVEADSDPISIPDETDFYFGYATPPGKVAWRDLDHGSWYVSELCRALCSHATYADLHHMVQEVHAKVGTDYKNEGFKQAPEATSRLRKDIYFF